MNTRKFAAWLAAFLVVVGVMVFWFTRVSDEAAAAAARQAAANPAPTAPANPAATKPGSVSPVPLASPRAPQPPTDWKHVFDQGGGVVEAFAAAASAAEAGDAQALRTIRLYVVTCERYFGAEIKPWMTNPQELPAAGGLDQFGADERCALVARRPEFADKLTAEYWTKVAEDLGVPLFLSYRATETLRQLMVVQKPEERAALQASARSDISEIIHSRDPTAWFDLGTLISMRDVNADPSYGLALVLAACDIGYDCTFAPLKDGTADTMQRRILDGGFSPDLRSSTKARYFDLQSLVRAEDWDAIEKYLQLDGPVFK